MEVHHISSIAFRNKTISINTSERSEPDIRLNYQTFDKKIEKIFRRRVEMRKESLMKEIYHGLSHSTPEWAVYGICLTNALFILIMVLASVFEIIPCGSVGDFIKIGGASVNSYLTLYFASRTEHDVII